MSKFDEIRERWKMATPGPWAVEHEEQPLEAYALELRGMPRGMRMLMQGRREHGGEE